MKSLPNLLTTLMLALLTFTSSEAQILTGTIQGRVIDADTKAPLIGATTMLVDTKLGNVTDMNGEFTINNVPVGGYSIRVNYMGYDPVTKTDVIVKSKHTTFVEVELHESSIQSKEVVVTPGYFERSPDQPTSMTTFSYEEIRRAPGSMGDVSRIIMNLPSIAKVNDQSNSLIVRGGSPMENEFLVDGIEVPNINHFPTQGATGGPIGLLNVDLIQDVTFSAGGFPATYGDKLSSVMEIKLRDGDRNERNTQLDFNIAGIGGETEGPIAGGKGSYLLSVRRDYLNALAKIINIGTSVPPSYGDAQLKLSYDISPEHSLNLLDVFSDDHNNPDRGAAIENDMVYYGNQDIYMNTAGVSWRALWSGNVYSFTAISYSMSKYSEDWFETNGGVHIVTNNSLEGTARLFTSTHIRLSDVHSLEFGFECKNYLDSYDNFYSEYTGALGDTTNAELLNTHLKSWWAGGFVNYVSRPTDRLTVTLGSRMDYFQYNNSEEISPRLSASYNLNDLTTLEVSTGIYYQDLPLLLLSQNPANKNLKTPRAIHYIVGVEQMLTESTKLTVEAYQKDYSHFPIDPTEPGLFLVDELFYRYGFFFSHGTLTDAGNAQARGVEVSIQKKLAKDFYGLASATHFRTRYEGGDGIWRNRVFDNRFIFSVEGGYKPNNEWEFSARWIFAGGIPYTPFNVLESQALGREVLDQHRINSARLPDYHSLDLRVDRRFYFSSSNLVAYLSVWNAYNHKNVAQYFWNAEENKQGVIYQWSLLPIFGVEYEF
jgi:hypothetical protein